MSVIAAVASAAPSPLPSPEVITRLVPTTSHLFQLAEIVKYFGLGVGISLIHTIVNGRYGLPKALNKALPILYSAVVAVAVLFVGGELNWSDWYQVAIQVVAGAVSIYALISVVNAVSAPGAAPDPAPAPTTTDVNGLPVTTKP